MVTGTPRIVTDGLVLYLDAANTKSYHGSGTAWTDLSVSQTSASLFNGPTFDSSNGGSISFDGTNDYGSIPSISSILNNQYSLQAWVKIPSVYPASASMFITNRSGSDEVVSFQFAFDNRAIPIIWNPNGVANNRTVVGTVGRGSTAIYVYRTGSLTGNQWALLTLTVGSSISLYYNGLLSMVSASSGTFQNPNVNIRLGNQYGVGLNDYPVQGNIAQMAVYNRALSADEVLQNYESTRERFGV